MRKRYSFILEIDTPDPNESQNDIAKELAELLKKRGFSGVAHTVVFKPYFEVDTISNGIAFGDPPNLDNVANTTMWAYEYHWYCERCSAMNEAEEIPRDGIELECCQCGQKHNIIEVQHTRE